MEKIKDRFSYLIYLSIFLKKEKDRELMTSLSSKLENLGPQKKKKLNTSWCLFDNRVDGRPGNFSYCKLGDFEGEKLINTIFLNSPHY